MPVEECGASEQSGHIRTEHGLYIVAGGVGECSGWDASL
jgi:hypothetical protein